jgi:hypothetical protein
MAAAAAVLGLLASADVQRWPVVGGDAEAAASAV